jgi:hypothetical protein
VFRENVDWLERVDAIAIELHDDSDFGRATEDTSAGTPADTMARGVASGVA